jgi:hypothetical protein
MLDGRRPSTKIVPPSPPEFREKFIQGGWRMVERLYGARTGLLLVWIEMNGGEELYTLRRAEMERQGKGAPMRGKPWLAR